MIMVTQEGTTATVTIANPEKHNRLTTTDMQELTSILRQLSSDPKIRVGVITGAGDKAFCVGADLGEFRETSIILHRERNELYRHLCIALHEMRRPLIARVNGTAVAGGMGLVALSHFAIATEEARFGTPEIKVGAFPSMVMTGILRAIPMKVAMRMILLGDTLDAKEALAAGLVNAVVPRDVLDNATAELAEKLASKSPAIMTFGLDAIRISDDMPFLQALEYLQEIATMIRCTEDCQEGVRAFLEKREPVWTGR